MNLVSMLLVLVFRDQGGSVNAAREQILAHVPRNLREALARFNLGANTTIYAACPRCNYTYAPTFSSGSSDPIYPERCTNTPRPGRSVCDETLLHPRISPDSPYKPRKPYIYQHFHDYLSGLLSQPSIESAMDEACDHFMEKLREPVPTELRSVFDADFLRSFYLDKDKKTLFLDRPHGEGRYAFALFFDFFSAEGKSLHSGPAALGLIAMACLNLPKDIRYKPENIYLAGIIPGPTEPPLEQANHYVRPLVDDMLDSWTTGVRFTRTSLCPDGRLTRSAIVLGVFDLPAARKMAALAAFSANWFCSICNLHGRHHIPRTDFESWLRRSPTELRTYAEQWRDAISEADQDAIFEKHGVRWSQLWRLPYWDPTRMLVVDSMHCLFEGLVEDHCRIVLNLSVANAKSPV